MGVNLGGNAVKVVATGVKIATNVGTKLLVVGETTEMIVGTNPVKEYIFNGSAAKYEAFKYATLIAGFAVSYSKGYLAKSNGKYADVEKVPVRQTAKSCFVAGTLIHTKNGEKPIEEIRVGDMVYSENPETGEKGLKKVTNTFIHDKATLLDVYVGETKIETTVEHPFWVVGKGWTLAEKLKLGDKLLLHSGKILKNNEFEMALS